MGCRCELLRSTEPLIIWAILFLGFALTRARFSITFKPDGLFVTQLTKQVLIPYANIDQMYVNQDILDKVLHLRNFLIKTNSPPERVFGIAVIYGKGFPGVRGNILTIPGLKPEDVLRIKNHLLGYRRDLSEINELGLGHPYHHTATLLSNYLTIGLLIFMAILAAALGVLYLYLKLTSGA